MFWNGPFSQLKLRDGTVLTGKFFLLKFMDGSPHAYQSPYDSLKLIHYIDVVESTLEVIPEPWQQ